MNRYTAGLAQTLLETARTGTPRTGNADPMVTPAERQPSPEVHPQTTIQ